MIANATSLAACHACATGSSTTVEASTSCTFIAPGSYTFGACPPGHFCAGAAHPQTPCPPGTFQDELGQTECKVREGRQDIEGSNPHIHSVLALPSTSVAQAALSICRDIESMMERKRWTRMANCRWLGTVLRLAKCKSNPAAVASSVNGPGPYEDGAPEGARSVPFQTRR